MENKVGTRSYGGEFVRSYSFGINQDNTGQFYSEVEYCATKGSEPINIYKTARSVQFLSRLINTELAKNKADFRMRYRRKNLQVGVTYVKNVQGS